MNGQKKNILTPLILGHEFVGVIEKTGRNVHDFKEGNLVSGEGHIVCGRCRNCLAGRRHLCKDSKSIGISRDGAYAEYLSIPVTNVWYCDRGIPMEVLSCFDPLGNAVHTALSFDVLGEDVLITGAGPIGIMAAAIAIHAGARYVVITDINPDRLNLAEQFGVTRAVNTRYQNISEVMSDLDMKEGFDVGLEMSGNAEAFREMIKNMCHGGKIAMLGIQEHSAMIDWDIVVFNGLTIKGIYGREMYETWYKMTSMIKSGLNIKPLITHCFKYNNFEQGFEAMRTGKSGKVILDWE